MRGYQKKVVYLKNTGSPVFEEAYFIIKSDYKEDDRYAGNALIEEANRIVEENKKLYYGNKTKRFSLGNLVIFGIGFLSAAILSLLFFIF